MTTRRRQRWPLALASSLAVHACLVAWLGWTTVEPTRAPPVKESKTKLVWLDAASVPLPSAPNRTLPATTTPARAPPATTPPQREVRPHQLASPSPATASPVPGAADQRTASSADAPQPPRDAAPAQKGDEGAAPLPDDAPRGALALLPPARFDRDAPPQPVGGRTLHPEDLPSDAERLADEQARVSELVAGWAHRDAARARVQGGGLVDPAYGSLGSALRAATDDVPRFIDTDSVKEVTGALLQSWGAGAERYGKTGAPYAEPEGRLESAERPSMGVEAAMRGSPDAQALVSFLSAGARLQEFADGRAGLELYALVELTQSPGGALESVTLLRPSGLQPFDRWVTGRAREVGLAFVHDAGAREKKLRSVWRFDGIIVYRRKVKPGELNGRAMLGMATMAALSMLSSLGHDTGVDPTSPTAPPRPLGPRMPGITGRFDELTGEVDVVDLTNPTYDCRVTLLEAD